MDYAEARRAGQVHRPSTTVQAESYLRLHAYPTLGRRPIGGIRRGEIQASVKTVSDVEALAAAVPHRFRTLIVFAAGTGLRQGECFGLTVDRVNFLRRTARVDRQLISVRVGVPEWARLLSDVTST